MISEEICMYNGTRKGKYKKCDKKDTTDNTTQLFDAVKDCVENCVWL